ncbi:hypothetical protein [Dyadobacter sp. CY347]|uniref:hypothetical protein n=1 Tax=Dyadobacter sp. CY347 TaxID=2909336 RepID=UPI001F15ED49|nr:hypothetical protein [Dyadobacter sp. CY347]MCF2487964.1 hypothetical protein [Dyadobacter sp. CY347]
MDVIIFLKAIGNLVFAAILFLAVFITAGFSIVLNLLKQFKPVQLARRNFSFRRR